MRYAAVICEHFSDRVTYFSTINEPQIITKMGYYDGLHAPGYRLSMLETLDILHALAKAHALAVPAMRRAAKSVFQVPEICAIHAVKMKRISVPQEL